ncbi:uncharacterized protein PAN0_010c3977 [Moesziomyces antarcticus]|uniref:Uncharacterized protein n=2 Tax=Pseudozyma antarctica TaxID=84753 RepID=A0A5C3FLX2_PSEA2|nr:uncharacterized protein PAN0_010c3977 [Moesziomyces antarcticus]GAK65757.1 conserved hypothetical protein [Moesziomyces antarcticus]SPO45384.1 uncharacterized protein PSANT_03070 [Moesziomyces antarcticus]
MPVPDIAAAAAPADLSLSQSMSASASELKRPASAASSLDDSQTLSRTKAAKSHYARAARAFLAKDLPTALVQSQLAADLISASNQLGSSLTASSFLNDADLDVQKLVEKIAVLRLTVFTQVYTDQRTLASVTDALTQAKQKAGSDGAAMDRVALLLSKQPLSLISHLWFEALRLCSHTSSDADAPSLDPTPETIHLAIELPASVVSSAVLAALRLDALEPATRTGTNAARLIAEWYLASFSSAFGAAPPTPRAAAAYENIVGLYSLHVLASRLGEWEYAREFVGYSSLAESVKFGLLEQIGEAQAHLTAQTQREQDAIASAQKAYTEEKHKRAEEDKQAKQAAAAAAAANTTSKGASKAASKARDIASGIGNFLSSKTDSGAQDSAQSSPLASGTVAETGGSSHRKRSQSPTYFSPRNGAGESSSSSSTSPAISPGSTRSAEGSSKATSTASGMEEEAKSARRSMRRSSSSRSSDAGNESSTSAASNHSRRSVRKEAREARETKETRFKDDAGYASTRAHLSRYIEGDHRQAGSSSSRRDPVRGGASSSSSLLSTLTAMFDWRKSSQPRTWLMSAIVMMLVFYRVVRRTPASVSATTTRRNAAVRETRNKLVGRTSGGASAGSGVLGFNWILLVWNKVLATIKM